jgi:hypothetical protein
MSCVVFSLADVATKLMALASPWGGPKDEHLDGPPPLPPSVQQRGTVGLITAHGVLCYQYY